MSEQEDLIYANTTLVKSTLGPEKWVAAVWYLFFIYMLCCVLTIKLPYCKKEIYGEYFGCCLCLLYRDIISTVIIIILNTKYFFYYLLPLTSIIIIISNTTTTTNNNK